MFKVKKKNNPVFEYTVLWVLYELGRALFLIYDNGNFTLRPASEFVLVEHPEESISEEKDVARLKEDLAPSKEG